MIAITGASGQLGRLVIHELLKTVAPENLVAVVRNREKVSDLAARGVQIRQADYRDETALLAALTGVEKLLLISSSEVGQRTAQHSNIINAAVSARVKMIAYTSLLHADSSPIGLAKEHIATEKMLATSGIPYVLLRNGWYIENYLASLPEALQHGVFIGSTGEGKISAAPRADYAAAAAKVLTSKHTEVASRYELAGDSSWTLTELVAEVSKQSGKPLVYQNLTEANYNAALLSAGLPQWLADMLSDSDASAAKGALFDDSRQLSTLPNRPTEPMAESVRKVLAQ